MQCGKKHFCTKLRTEKHISEDTQIEGINQIVKLNTRKRKINFFLLLDLCCLCGCVKWFAFRFSMKQWFYRIDEENKRLVRT
ncbi:hypothetical protein JHK87_031369 [Glycine soja]|nr:hypothetical protein JHK87_031369 [Glycine soja]